LIITIAFSDASLFFQPVLEIFAAKGHLPLQREPNNDFLAQQQCALSMLHQYQERLHSFENIDKVKRNRAILSNE
jgi:hypothetical protein